MDVSKARLDVALGAAVTTGISKSAVARYFALFGACSPLPLNQLRHTGEVARMGRPNKAQAPL